MFWADALAQQISERYGKKRPAVVIRDEKTVSGRVHVGSMRGVAIHGLISEILTERGAANTFLYEINDFDVLDSIPSYLAPERFQKHLGALLCDTPSPDGDAANYAEYFAAEFTKAIAHAGFVPQYYRGSELYRSGRMNEVIRVALEKAHIIREVYAKVSGSVRDASWLPFHALCENCGKIATTEARDFDGKTVSYSCRPDKVDYTKGCGHSARRSPFDGGGKLPWKVEWAAKWVVMDVHVEGGGKDHSTKGGARDVANHIAREVYAYEPPLDIPYEFFLVGGAKMSSSKGKGSSALEVSELLPPHVYRLALLGHEIGKAINFNPEGDTVPVLFDQYDRLAKHARTTLADDYGRLFHLVHPPLLRSDIPERFLPRFSQIAFLVQMPHLKLLQEVERMKGGALTEVDRAEYEQRAYYARVWLEQYAPAEFRFELQTEAAPASAREISVPQKQALAEILRYVETSSSLEGEAMHRALHAIKEKSGLTPKEFFAPIYRSFLDRESGPKLGWFLSTLPREFLIARLKEVLNL